MAHMGGLAIDCVAAMTINWRVIAVGGAAVVVGGLLYLFVTAYSQPSTPVALGADTVSSDWNEAVRRLNIEPIYPPQEDIHVGDIYAAVTRADRNFQGKSVKLWHADLSEAIKRTYKNVPIFPPTKEPPGKDGQFWPQAEVSDLFDVKPRTSLSLVAFPRYVIRHARQADGGIGASPGLWAKVSGLFAASGSSDDLEELHFPAAETYGVNAVEASAALALFCNKSPAICSETGVRSMLSMIVGKDVWDPEISKDGKETGRFAMGVELMLVNQVFLTRSIVRTHLRNNGRGFEAAVSAPVKEPDPPAPSTGPVGAAPEPPAAQPGAGGQVGGAGESAAITAREQLQQKQNEIARLTADLAKLQNRTGARMGASATEGNTIGLNEVFPRPIVIGVRAVRLLPTPSPPTKKLKDGT